jgi:ribonuclease HI
MDGSLTGLGCRLFKLNPPSDSEHLLGHMKAVLGEDLRGDSSYQNTMELLAVVWGLAGLGQLGYQNCGIRIRGDSDTVLRWTSATRGSFGSTLARGSLIAFVAVCQKYDFVIDRNYQWISGSDNCACDALSRQVAFPPEELGEEVVLECGDELMHWCTPANNPVGDVELNRRFNLVMGVLPPRAVT